jgi:aldose 1-epimerase
MFQHESFSFGKYEAHRIQNEHGTGFCLVPEYGACLLELNFNGQQVLDAYKTPEELDFNRWSKNVFLYPFPNRLKNGQYTWEGKSYQFPINDGSTGNALHGFGSDKALKVDEVLIKEAEASMQLSYQYEGNIGAYPFPFIFRLSLKIEATGNLEVNMTFQNTGPSAIPIGWGWHPYFKLSDKVELHDLQTPAIELIGIDKYMIPTGKHYAFDEFLSLKKIGSTVLDNCFKINHPGENAVIQLNGDKGKLRYWQETGLSKYNFVQLFTPPYRESLAIEPMTCNVDAFNNLEGLIQLEAGASSGCSFGLSFEAN